MALLNFHHETNNRSDIQIFLQQHRPDAAIAGVAYRFEDESVAGGVNSQQPATERIGREGNLDAQVMLGIGFPTPLVSYTVGDISPPFNADIFTPTNTNEPFLTWLQYLLAQPDPLPTVVSISYGDIEQTVPYGIALCPPLLEIAR
jgi:tripeptidyl-peptidase I